LRFQAKKLIFRAAVTETIAARGDRPQHRADRSAE
jgi:hypothetical protein